jgi:hypothetical protein
LLKSSALVGGCGQGLLLHQLITQQQSGRWTCSALPKMIGISVQGV